MYIYIYKDVINLEIHELNELRFVINISYREK